MPGPASRIEKTTWPRRASKETRTAPPRGVTLIALESRFASTCWMRSRSASIRGCARCAATRTRTPAPSASACTTSPASRATSSGATLPGAIASRPASIDARSRRSPTSRVICPPTRAIVAAAARAGFPSSRGEAVRRTTSAAAPMVASGVRRSCETTASMSSRARTASRTLRCRRAFSSASAQRVARSSATARSSGPKRRSVPAMAKSSTPTRRPRARSGTARKERSPIGARRAARSPAVLPA